MALPTSIASEQHNHQHCIDAALNTARQLCQQQGARMTALREQVLRLIWQSHKPLGAYQLMEMLAAASTRKVAPPTVYRALDFLLELGLVHRINTLNAFVGCTHPEQVHATNFLICRDCGVAIEFSQAGLQQGIRETLEHFHFELESQSIELVGRCATCQAGGAST